MLDDPHQPDEPEPPPFPEPVPGEPVPGSEESRFLRFMRRAWELIVGPARRLTDPALFHKVSLAAFLAWVGLGADGLSSSAYGPEAAFLALGEHTFLAIPLALLVGFTVLIISASYIRIIERFPAGGGGYVVASKLLGPSAGLISGSALIIDYILTITISLAACSDSLFSLASPNFQPYKLAFTIALLLILTILNLRGVRESVTIISPIFLIFLLSHVGAIVGGIFINLHRVPTEFHHLAVQSTADIQVTGWFPLAMILLRAFTLGGGTFTGIEAVSEGVPLLRDPKVETAKKTMRYMAVSLAFVASGILMCYLLYQIQPVPGRTLNAVLWGAIAGQFFPPGSPLAEGLVAVILVSAGTLLFVAAQTGFLGGPRVLVFMALDRWVPSRFSNLSERLVASNGVYLMATGALAVLLATKGNVHLLVVLYSINVFLTFALAQLGMVRDAINLRRQGHPWAGPMAISGLGFVVTGFLFIGTVMFKFTDGGWATLLVTGVVAAICVAVRRHYTATAKNLRRLDEALTTIPVTNTEPNTEPLKRHAQTAVLTVTSFGGLGIHTLLNLFRIFPNQYKQVVFVSIAGVDSGQFKGTEEIEHLRENTVSELKKYVEFTRRLGIPADYRYAMGTDIVDELETLCLAIYEEYPRAVIVGGQLVFQKEDTVTRWLHNQTCPALQRRLAFHGRPMVILPVRVY